MWSPSRRVSRLSRLGALRRRAGDLTGAEYAYRRALVVAERHLPGDDLRAARLRKDLGVVLKYTGAFDEAAALYTQVHTVFVARLGPAHPDVGMVLHNIGGLSHARGRPADGETAARAAVSIRSAALGDDHPATAADRSALAAILDATGRHDDAEQLLKRALEVFERRLGSQHHEVGVTLGSLGVIDARRGDSESAECRLRRALAIKERWLGRNHPELVPTLGTLGYTCQRTSKRGDARALYQRAVALLERQGLGKHPQATALRVDLALLDATSGRDATATRCGRSPSFR